MAALIQPASNPICVEAWLPGFDGHQFYTRTYAPPPSAGPPKAAILFIHGFVEHCARYEWAHGALAAKGVAAFARNVEGARQLGKSVQDLVAAGVRQLSQRRSDSRR